MIDPDLVPVFGFLLGLIAGIQSGLLGVGGGIFITPGLNIIGLSMPAAVATSLTQMVAASAAGCFRHGRAGRIYYSLMMLLGLTLGIGVFLGKSSMVYLQSHAIADTTSRWIFIILLSVIGLFMVRKTLRQRSQSFDDDQILRPPFTRAWFLYSLPIVGVGILSGLLGLGGGFFLVPTMIYLFRLDPKTASATSLGVIFIGAISGTWAYSSEGLADYSLAALCALGSVLGGYFGASCSRYIRGGWLKLMFAISVCFGALAMLLRQLDFILAAFCVLAISALGMTAMTLIEIYRGFSKGKANFQ